MFNINILFDEWAVCWQETGAMSFMCAGGEGTASLKE